MTTPLDLSALRALAEAADDCGAHIYNHPRDSNNWQNNEAFIRACRPEVILALLDRVDALEWVARTASTYANNFNQSYPQRTMADFWRMHEALEALTTPEHP